MLVADLSVPASTSLDRLSWVAFGTVGGEIGVEVDIGKSEMGRADEQECRYLREMCPRIGDAGFWGARRCS